MNEITTAPQELEHLAAEIRILSRRAMQDIIEIGQRLVEAKKRVPHGEWGEWLASKVNFSQVTAWRFMQCAERLANFSTLKDLAPSQAFALLALPAGDVAAFIDAKEEAGETIADTPTRTLQEEVKKWKQRADAAEERAELASNAADRFQEEAERAQKELAETEEIQEQEYKKWQQERQELKNREPEKVEVPPADYEDIKRENEMLKITNDGLSKQNQALQQSMEVAEANRQGKTHHEWLEEHGRKDPAATYDAMLKKAEALGEFIDRYCGIPQGVELREYVRCYLGTWFPDREEGLEDIRFHASYAMETFRQLLEIVGEGDKAALSRVK